MKNKKLLLISIFLIFIISIGVASASDNIQNDNLNADMLHQSQDNGNVDLSINNENIGLNINTEQENQNNNINLDSGKLKENEQTQTISNPDEAETTNSSANSTNANQNTTASTLKTNQKTFEDIQVLIDNAKSGSTIKLNGTYIGNSKQIVINKALTIKGINGKATLNAKGLSRIFNITTKGVVLENLNLINGKSEFGGAIYAHSTSGKTYSLKVNKCVFKNNTAKCEGGAIYSVSNLKVTNSKFTSNTARSGGAICCEDTDDINKDKVYINRCTFYKNKCLKDKSVLENVIYNYGGGILTDFRVAYIYNSKFSSNSAKTEGGAISTTRTIICKNCKFYKNTAKSGSVIYVCPNIIDFEEYSFHGKIKFENCILGTNKAKNNLLIDCNYETAKMYIKNLIFGKYKYTITNHKNKYLDLKVINKKTKKAVKGAKIRVRIQDYELTKKKAKTYKTNKKGKIRFDIRSITKYGDWTPFYMSFANSKKYSIKNYGFVH